MSDPNRPMTRDAFEQMVAAALARPEFTEPAAFGLGVATIADADGAVLDTWFASINLAENIGFAAALHDVCGTGAPTGTVRLTAEHIDEIRARSEIFRDELQAHPNLAVIEGLAGSTLHAMSHLDGDGDGLGQRTSHGYLFMINVLARPALMIIGFLVASALMIAVGTLQAVMFLPAMANVQGNSVTGLFSIAMFLVVFFVMNLTLITASFSLIYVITDQVIGFVGNAINSQLGRDTEDKVNNMFLMAARVGPNAIGEAKRASGGAKDAAAKLREKAGGGKGKSANPTGE